MTLYTVVKATGYLKDVFIGNNYEKAGKVKKFNGVKYVRLNTDFGLIWFRAENTRRAK